MLSFSIPWMNHQPPDGSSRTSQMNDIKAQKGHHLEAPKVKKELKEVFVPTQTSK
jgi:hypothetical protein